MKIITIGDLHGSGVWKKIVKDNEDADKFIFVADYFDSFYIPADKQKKNFIEIVDFKRKNKKKVELFIGNHDHHYLRTSHQRYVGHQKYQHIAIGELLENAIKEGLIKMCYLYDDILFSHAGVTKTWCKDNDIDLNNIEQSINDLFQYRPYVFEFIRGLDKYGDNVEQSPIWVRPTSLMGDKIDGYRQVVGHSVKSRLQISDGIAFIDTLGESGEYLIIKDGVMSASEDLTDEILLEKIDRVNLTPVNKKEYIINGFLMLLGLQTDDGTLEDFITTNKATKKINGIINAIGKQMPEEMKRTAIEMIELSIVMAGKKYGEDYTGQDVHETLTQLFIKTK